MPHVITQSCASDASCVYACPVNCIQPTPDDPEFALAEMLHIDPVSCVDYGACVKACPVDAIKPDTALTDAELPFGRSMPPGMRRTGAGGGRSRRRSLGRWRSAATWRRCGSRSSGRGRRGCTPPTRCSRSPARAWSCMNGSTAATGWPGSASRPDHLRTRQISRQFDQILARPGLVVHTGVHVGVDITHAQLLGCHDAVIYAVGAGSDKRLEIPGSDLPGLASATSFVGWYNGQPDYAAASFDLSHPRMVVIGNGNVALDVARILTVDPDRLATTDIAPAALQALRTSQVEEVVITGRRGPERASFTLPELLGLSRVPGVDLRFDPVDAARAPKLAAIPLRHGIGGRRVRLRSI
jgi:ferredoxin/flavodoxin---NADP+ reductase